MSRYPRGIDLLKAGKCPKGAFNPAACMLCGSGHMLECHHPLTCEEAECDHYKQAREAEL